MITKKGKIIAEVRVKNVGEVAGEAIVQMYICDNFASLVRPVKELKGYQKVMLLPGEERKIKFKITEDMLKFYTENGKFEVEDGTFTLWISDCSNTGDPVKFEYSRKRK